MIAPSTDPQGADESTARQDSSLTNEQKRAVSDHIKSVSAGHGVTNALLFAGVPNHESGLVQCWKDATWACQGPHSSYCGGPVIAGSGDGPCSHKQGGLGMYQLDAGTYSLRASAPGVTPATRTESFGADEVGTWTLSIVTHAP